MVPDGRSLLGLPGLAALAGRFLVSAVPRRAGLEVAGWPLVVRALRAAGVRDRGHDLPWDAHTVDGLVRGLLVGVVAVASIATFSLVAQGAATFVPGDRVHILTGSLAGKDGEVLYALKSGRYEVVADGYETASGMNFLAASSLEPITSPTPTPTPTSTPVPKAPWTTPIPASPVLDANSDAWAGKLASPTEPGGGTSIRYFNANQFGMPVYTAAAGDPTRTVTSRNGNNDFGPYNPIRWPANAQSNNGGDGWTTILDPTAGRAYNCWQTRRDAAGNISCQNGGTFPWPNDAQAPPLRGMGVGGGTMAGTGAITIAEANACRGGDVDAIHHALFASSRYSGPTFRYPANKSDGGQDPVNGVIPEGSRVQMNPGLAVPSGISQGERCVFRALQTYGMYIVDVSDHAISITGDPADLNDPCRASPASAINHPGDPSRVGGAFHLAGLAGGNGAEPCPEDNVPNGYRNFPSAPTFPWTGLRVLRTWDGS